MADQILKVGQQKDKALLTKSQKEFNRLTKRIAKLRTDIRLVEEVSARLHQRMITVLLPLQQKFVERRAAMVRLFDKACRTGSFKSQERKKLGHLIQMMAFELILEEGMDDLKEIYNRYSKTSFEDEIAAADQQDADDIRELMEQMFGLNIEEKDEMATPEQRQAFFEKRMAEEMAAQEEHWRRQEERQANRPKTARQLEKEEQRAEEEKKISKSVREVYLELVKAFHPDLEQDEGEKQRKTEVMQRVTQAYEHNDLLTLLQLQLEFEQIDQDHLESLAEDRLRHFIKILRRQVAELDEALYEAQHQLPQLPQQPMRIVPPLYLEELFERDLKRVKSELRRLEKDLQLLADPGYLKIWLKDYEVK